MQSIGVEIGGTFTDLVRLRDGEIVTGKTSTVIDDPAKGATNCLKDASTDLRAVEVFLHGSTIAINTVLERKGARVSRMIDEDLTGDEDYGALLERLLANGRDITRSRIGARLSH